MEFGGFSYEAFLKRATPVCKRIYNAVNSNNIEIIDYMLSDALADEEMEAIAASEAYEREKKERIEKEKRRAIQSRPAVKI